jgi:hypothetical protein
MQPIISGQQGPRRFDFPEKSLSKIIHISVEMAGGTGNTDAESHGSNSQEKEGLTQSSREAEEQRDPCCPLLLCCSA